MKIKLVLFFIAIVIAIYDQTIKAQSEIQIEEILVSNTKIIDLPESKIFDEQIKLMAPRDIGDIFKSMTGFGVIKRGGYAMEPVFRSFKYEQINMMFDGSMKIVPACPNRMDPMTTHVNPEEISKIEIIKGPYSVRYGQSFGGIINLVTLKKAYTDTLEFHGMTSAGFQTNGEGKTLGLNLNTGNKYFDFDISGGLKDFGNYKSGWNLEIPSSFKSYDYAIKIGVNPTSNQRVLVSWRQSFGRDIMHAGLPMDTEKDDSRMLSFDYTIRNLNDLIFELNIKAYYSDVDHIMSNLYRPNYAMSNAVANVFSKTYGGKIEAGISIAENNILYTGIDYAYVWKDGDRQRKVFYNACSGMSFDPPMEFTDLIWQNSNLSNFGYYIESKNNLSDRLSLIGGLRIDLDNAQIKDPAPDFESTYSEGFDQEGTINFSGNITFNFKANEKYHYQLAFGRGVRAPNLTERYINHFNVGMDAYEYVGNPELKAEKNHQADFSIHKTGDILSFELNIFTSYITDFIDGVVDTTLAKKFLPCQPPANAKRFVNINKAFQAGYEISAKYSFYKNLSIEGNLYYTYAQNLDNDEPLSEIPPLSSIIALNFKNKKFYSIISARFAAEQKRVAESAGETPSDAFNTLDLKIGYKPFKMLELDLGVNNIFNANYYEHLNRPFKNLPLQSQFYEPGRNFVFTVRVKF